MEIKLTYKNYYLGQRVQYKSKSEEGILLKEGLVIGLQLLDAETPILVRVHESPIVSSRYSVDELTPIDPPCFPISVGGK